MTVWPGVAPIVRMMAWLRAWSWAANTAATVALIRARATRKAATVNPRLLTRSWSAMSAAGDRVGIVEGQALVAKLSTPVRNARAVINRVMPTVSPNVLARNLPRRRLARAAPAIPAGGAAAR